MNQREFRKQNPELFRLWVRHKFKFGENPIPQKDKNYIIAIVNDSWRCFVVLEYNDGWYSKNENDKTQDINIPSKEIISFQSQDISENEFESLLIEIIKIYSTEDLNNQLVICCRTNGPGQIVFDFLRKEINMLEIDNVTIFPTSRRSKYGKELFKSIGTGWDMGQNDVKDCFDAMRTAQGEGFFILATDKTKQMFMTTSIDNPLDLEPFIYCWMMLSFIRLSTMQLFSE